MSTATCTPTLTICASLTSGLYLLICFGCTRPNCHKVITLEDLPEIVELDGQPWHRVSVSDEDHRVLQAAFRQIPSLADNPVMTGTFAVYRAADGTRRYYWVHLGVKEPYWGYMEVDGVGRFRKFVEGVGLLSFWECTSESGSVVKK